MIKYEKMNFFKLWEWIFMTGIIAGMIAIILLFIFNPIASNAEEYSIEITGSEEIEFNGSLTNENGGTSINGIAKPTEIIKYKISGKIISIAIQKMQISGNLVVAIRQGNKTLNYQYTNAPYGMITLNYVKGG